MKRNLYFLFLSVFAWLTGTTVQAQGAPESLQQDAEGYYLLGTMEDVEIYAEWVNMGGDAVYSMAKLTADIDYKGASHTPIGHTTGIKFNGVFDGQQHRILNMIIDEPDRDLQGFFGALRGGATVRNLIIDKTCSVTGRSFVGGLSGSAQTIGDGPVTIENCVNEATVTAMNGTASGIVGAGQSQYATLIIRNCVNAGNITGKTATAFCSWNNQGGSILHNCLNMGTIEGVDMSGGKYDYYTQLFRYEPGKLDIQNVFDLSDTELKGQGLYEDWQTADPLKGELCYMLNGDQSVITWYQLLSEEGSYPVPYYIEGGQVYLNSAMGCDGKPLGEATYSNNKTSDIPPHEYEDGVCSNCGHIQSDYAPLEDGFYMLSNGSQLYWFSLQVNINKNYAWNAKLTNDIDMDMYSDLFTPLGDINSGAVYQGTFDGQGHVISNLHINSASNFTGFVGRAGNGLEMKNLVLDATCSISGGECSALVGGTDQMSGNVTLRNLGNLGNVYSFGKQAAGIFGGNAGSKTTLVVDNCFSTGYIEGTDQCAALVGWAGSNNPTVTNCWSCSEVVGNDNEAMYLARRSNGTFTNNYCLYGTQTPELESEDIESGALCYRLNQNQGATVWFQNIDKGERDYNPYPFSEGHAQVYPVGNMRCDGSVVPGEVHYSNSDAATRPDHKYHEGFCDVCGGEDPDYEGFLPLIVNPDYTNGDGWTSEGTNMTVAEGVAEHYNHAFHTYQDIADVPNGVYKVRLQGFSRAADALDEDIYGDGELSDDLLRNSYFYAESAGKRVARRFVDITTGKQGEYKNEGTGELELADGTIVPNSRQAYSVYFSKGIYWNKPLYLAVTDGTLRLGVSNQFYTNGCTTVWDRWRIEYVGDDEAAYTLIAKQTAAEAQDFQYMESQEPLKAEYLSIVEKAASQTEPEAILTDADKASRLPDQIKTMAVAYLDYVEAVEAFIEEWKDRDDLQGEAAEVLRLYLAAEEEPNDVYPHGTYLYIKTYRLLNANELQDELKFMQKLYADAVAGNISTGADITALLTNADYSNPEQWYGWNHEEFSNTEGTWNIAYRGDVPDVYPIVAAYNTGFDVNQEITGLPNGIYELQTNAWYRPGQGGEGDVDGYDVVPVQLYLNEFQTPVMNVYQDVIDYMDAVNGVNCRYDATGDPAAPHNGELTNRVDRNVGFGYMPDDAVTGAFAFHGGRYAQKAYAIVENGTLKVGVRNDGSHWRNKNLTVWGGFQLFYHAESTNKLAEIYEHYADRLEHMEYQRMGIQEYIYSQSHADRISELIAAGASADAAKGMQIVKELNAEFASIPASHAIFKELADVGSYLLDLSDAIEDPDLARQMSDKAYEIQNHAYDGDMTDEEAKAYLEELMEDPELGGVYMQGDLYDEMAENGAWDYNQVCKLYPLTKNAEGKYVGTFTLQNRHGQANANGRAGFYLRRMNRVYKCAETNQNFVTPAKLHFRATEGGQDFQAINGTYDIVFDLEHLTVDLTLKGDYHWNNQVYVTGTLVYDGGTHRWANNEAVPLQHVGEGKYVGTVELVNDNANPYCSFGIITSRSTVEMVNYSTTNRNSWTEARYGSEEQYLEIGSGQKVENLVRGLDRTWRISPAGKYLIEFDMNHSTMVATLLETEGKGTAEAPYLVKTKEDLRTMQDKLVKNRTTYFRLENDIDLKDCGWWPLNNEFFGNSMTESTQKAVVLDGNNHIIKNLKPAVSEDNVYANGFFGTLVGQVKNLGFYAANVKGGNASNVGVLAGRLGCESTTVETLVENSYFAGTVTTTGNAGGVAGSVENTANINNVYTYVAITGEGEDVNALGGLIGEANATLTVQHAYAAGQVAGSSLVAAENVTATLTDAFFWDEAKHDELCQSVATWVGWANDGKAGNGYPILEWQVVRGDHKRLCGFADPDGIGGIENGGTFAGFSTNEHVTVVDAAGRTVYSGRLSGMSLGRGLYLIKGATHAQKVMLK